MCFAPKSDSFGSVLLDGDAKYRKLNRYGIEFANLKRQTFKSACLQKSALVTKIIRIFSLQQLEMFQQIPGFFDNFYIIYLIRDPRAMFSSRWEIAHHFYKHKPEFNGTTLKLTASSQNLCNKVANNLAYLESEASEFIRDKILFVRYEDIALNPRFYLNRIYEFIGCNVEAKGKQQEDSEEDTCGFQQLKDEFLALTETKLQNGMAKRKTYDTTGRNSNQAAFSWMSSLAYRHVKNLQDACGAEILNDLGYKIYNTEYEYLVDRKKEVYDYDVKSVFQEWRLRINRKNFAFLKKRIVSYLIRPFFLRLNYSWPRGSGGKEARQSKIYGSRKIGIILTKFQRAICLK